MDQFIEEPTYFAGGMYISQLDHMYIQNCSIINSGVLDTYYSDHDATFADIALTHWPLGDLNEILYISKFQGDLSY